MRIKFLIVFSLVTISQLALNITASWVVLSGFELAVAGIIGMLHHAQLKTAIKKQTKR